MVDIGISLYVSYDELKRRGNMSTLLGWSPLILMVILGLIIFFIYRLVTKNRQTSLPTSNLESRVARLEEENRLLKEEANREM